MYGEKITKSCEYCCKEFTRYVSQGSTFCSRVCQIGWQRRAKVTVECAWCGEIFNKSQWAASRCERHFCSYECSNSKEFNSNWKGGTRRDDRRINEYKIWRLSVFERDKFTCIVCTEKGGDLQAHHIKSFARFPELRFNIDNGITLCKICHKDFHRLYGIKSFTSDDFYEWTKE